MELFRMYQNQPYDRCSSISTAVKFNPPNHGDPGSLEDTSRSGYAVSKSFP
jgi:hypothetical protein